MKRFIFILIVSFCFKTADGQILNGSFENGSNPDLSNWEWTCLAESDKSAPAGDGDWCIKVYGGNYQSCFPGYAYQKIPAITNEQTFILSCLAFAQTTPPIGLYFGKINKDKITLLSGVTTSSTSWTQLNIQSSFSLSTDNTAIVVLDGGHVGGPAQSYGYFDLVNLQEVLELNSFERGQAITVFPNPFSNEATLKTDFPLNNVSLTVANVLGQTVKQLNTISGEEITLYRDNLPVGLYLVRLTQENKIIAIKKIIVRN